MPRRSSGMTFIVFGFSSVLFLDGMIQTLQSMNNPAILSDENCLSCFWSRPSFPMRMNINRPSIGIPLLDSAISSCIKKWKKWLCNKSLSWAILQADLLFDSYKPSHRRISCQSLLRPRTFATLRRTTHVICIPYPASLVPSVYISKHINWEPATLCSAYRQSVSAFQNDEKTCLSSIKVYFNYSIACHPPAFCTIALSNGSTGRKTPVLSNPKAVLYALFSSLDRFKRDAGYVSSCYWTILHFQTAP